MKKINTAIIFILLVNLIQAQNPLVKQWDYRLGGTNQDWLTCFQQTSDGGYILGGYSLSDSSGDKTQNNWDTSLFYNDFWIIKINALGNKQWDKTFGGTADDRLFSLQQTTDGGYILGGWSGSGISGDKTQLSWGGLDYWIVKINSLGVKQWDKRFGGTGGDYFQALQQTADGGYVLGGYSCSDSSGDKTQPCWGLDDFWIVKINSLGIKQWDKRFGGTNGETLRSLQQTTDGGYILGGWSCSTISGDKTQLACDIQGDYWLVKINSSGIKQWDKRFGSTERDELYSLKQTLDGGYILGGKSGPGLGCDKTQLNWALSYDYWIVKIDASGNKQWEKDLGGINNENQFANIFQTSDGGYLLSGTSASPLSGDKTENNLGYEQTWVVKTDSSGIKQWDKTIFTTGSDWSSYTISTNYGCYVTANTSAGAIGGYKTQPAWGGSSDYWIVKFCDSTLTTGINTASIFNFKISIYPNPFSSEISFTIQKQNINHASFTIKNIFGRTVFRKHENNLSTEYTKTIDLSFISRGIYLLDVIIDGERTAKKMVKE